MLVRSLAFYAPWMFDANPSRRFKLRRPVFTSAKPTEIHIHDAIFRTYEALPIPPCVDAAFIAS